MKYGKALSMAGGLAFTAVFLGLALRNVALSELWLVLACARWRWVPMMSGIVLLDLVVRSRRWTLLLSKKECFWACLRLEAIGLSVNNVLFLRLGELARAFLAGRELGISWLTALASVAVERVLDVAALLTLFCAASVGSPLVPAALRRAALLLLCGIAGALCFLVLARRLLQPGGALRERLKPWPKVQSLVLPLAQGAAALADPKTALEAALLSLGLWGVDAGLYWAVAQSLGLGTMVDYPRSILILSWAGAGAALPAAPGAFGTFEAMVKSLLQSFGASPHQALAYAFFSHMLSYLIVTLLGLVFLYRVGLSLGELKAGLEKARR
ncbi:MAG: flippase-like domain-containing protein [Elusimicrobia bacterium]|nr:flippase-like domain-containing protein [Elusimicrobiota bacterium]